MYELPLIEEPPPPPRSHRGLIVAAVAVLVVVVLVVALVNGHRKQSIADQQAPTATPSSSSAASPEPQSTAPGEADPLPTVSCPDIRDEQSHLGYSCIDNSLQQDGSDIYLGLRIALNKEVEPGWVMSEGSGNPLSVAQSPDNSVVNLVRPKVTAPAVPAAATSAPVTPAPSADDVAAAVKARIDLALQAAYGDNPTTATLSAQPRTFSGVAGFEQLTEITINPVYRASRKLTAKTERLWVVGLPTAAGVSIFMMSIPDERKDLWPKAEATVGTVHVI